MSKSSSPNLKRPLVALVKLGYYEIASIIALSGVFWLYSIPILTIGSAILSISDIIKSIYHGAAPNSEFERTRYFGQLVQENFTRGLPLSILIIFIFMNTFWYFTIALSGWAIYYIIGGIVGMYACILVILCMFRISNFIVENKNNWRTAIQSAIMISIRHPSFTILQISIAAIGMLASLLVPIAVLFLLPGGLALFELVFYKELTSTDPRAVLSRYKTNT